MSNFPTDTLSRGLFILDVVSTHAEGIRFAALLDACGGTASTTLNRLLKTLQETDHLEKRDNRYHIGPAFMKSARAALGTESIEQRVEPFLKELCEVTGDSAAFFKWDGDWIELAAKHEAPEGLRFTFLGSRAHPSHHAFLQAIQPWLPKKVLSAMEVHESTNLESIRSLGVVCKVEKFQYAHIRIAAPIFAGDSTGTPLGAIGIAIPADKLPKKVQQERISAVLQIASRLSQTLALPT